MGLERGDPDLSQLPWGPGTAEGGSAFGSARPLNEPDRSRAAVQSDGSSENCAEPEEPE
jgi:hypothetical protein